MKRPAISVLLAILLTSCYPQKPPRAHVLDGDTIELAGKRLRLFGIDAPELPQSCTDQWNRTYPCGVVSKKALVNLIEGQELSCEYFGTDHYHRRLARCKFGTIDISAFMVRSGNAVAYRRYSLDYVWQENEARSLGLGLWRGRFTMPEEYRYRSPAMDANGNEVRL